MVEMEENTQIGVRMGGAHWALMWHLAHEVISNWNFPSHQMAVQGGVYRAIQKQELVDKVVYVKLLYTVVPQGISVLH